MLEHRDAVGKENRLIAAVADRNPVIDSIKILVLADGKLQGRRIVAGILHLVDVPVGPQKRSVADPDIVSEALDLLDIPQREGVIVAMGNQKAILSYRIKIIPGYLDRSVAIAPVMVVPVFSGHQSRYGKAGKENC